MRSFKMTPNDAGQRLDKFVSKVTYGLPLSLMYKYIRQKRIKINGKRAEPSIKLQTDDLVEFFIPDEFFSKDISPDELRRTEVHPNIIYEDENIIICDKPAGILSHTGDPDEPGSGSVPERETLLFQIRAYLCQKGDYSPEEEHSFAPALCNRIDRNTGGLVIAAKTAESLREMNDQIKHGNVHKQYLCAVHGRMEKMHDILHAYLRRDTKKKTVYVTSVEVPQSKEIVTSYEVLSYNPQYDISLLRVTLLTGRTHQIRAHLSFIGHPLLGEGKYGANKNDRALGWVHQALYSYRLTFTTTGILSYLKGNVITVPQYGIRFLSLFPDIQNGNL